jgi:hypothetical protein
LRYIIFKLPLYCEPIDNIALLDRIDYILTLNYLAKNSMHTIQMRGGAMGYEKLRPVRTLTTGLIAGTFIVLARTRMCH